MRAFFMVAALAVVFAPAMARAEAELEILLDRRAGEVSVYFAMPAPMLDSVFGQGADGLLDADGTVDIDGLYDGTYLVADDIFSRARLSVSGQPVPVEALSMMLHDPDFLPGFADPYDAQVSIAVCTSPDTVRGMGLPELRAYLGYHAWKVDGRQALDITFPETGREALTFVIRDFADFREIATREVRIGDGGTLRLAAAPPAESGRAGRTAAAFGALAFAALLGSVLLIKGARRRRPATVRGS